MKEHRSDFQKSSIYGSDFWAPRAFGARMLRICFACPLEADVKGPSFGVSPAASLEGRAGHGQPNKEPSDFLLKNEAPSPFSFPSFSPPLGGEGQNGRAS